MEIVFKYFKFPDPINGQQTKLPGYILDKKDYFVHIKDVDGVATIIRDEMVEQHVERIPSSPGIEEISKEEYDYLDTGGESETLKQRRSKETLMIERLARRPTGTEEVSPAERMRVSLQEKIDAKKGIIA